MAKSPKLEEFARDSRTSAEKDAVSKFFDVAAYPPAASQSSAGKTLAAQVLGYPATMIFTCNIE